MDLENHPAQLLCLIYKSESQEGWGHQQHVGLQTRPPATSLAQTLPENSLGSMKTFCKDVIMEMQ